LYAFVISSGEVFQKEDRHFLCLAQAAWLQARRHLDTSETSRARWIDPLYALPTGNRSQNGKFHRSAQDGDLLRGHHNGHEGQKGL
jgi:hypothetical protein